MSLQRNKFLQQISLVCPNENAPDRPITLDTTVWRWQEFLKPIRKGLKLDWSRGTLEDWLGEKSVSTG